MSFQRTATKYALQMKPSTAIPDATSRNAVSEAMMLIPRPHQPHWNRHIPGFSDPCHSLPQPFNKHHNQLHPWSQNQILLFQFLHHDKGHPSAYTHLYTECSTCATTKVRPCQHSTKTPDHRDVTEEISASGSRNDVLNLESPWTMLGTCALRYWTLSLAQAP